MARPLAGESWPITAVDEGVRLDRFLAAPDRAGSRSRAVTALQRGRVFLNEVEQAVADASRPLTRGDVVRLWMDRPGSAKPKLGAFVDGALRVVHEDGDIIVVDKPAGILTVPLERRAQAASIYDLIENHWRSQGKRRPLVVHRIDRDTSGLVLFAVHARAQQDLKTQFRRREPERLYWAVVHGQPSPSQGEWHDRLVWNETALMQRAARADDDRGVDASCEYRVLESFDQASWIEVHLHTGKQNQIRIQAQLHGHPLVGERRYIDAADRLSGRGVVSDRISRQALHARAVGFMHPTTGQPLRFESAPPTDFQDLLTDLRRSGAARG